MYTMNSLAQQEVFESYLYMPDEDAVELAKDGDAVAEEHLINKYKNFVRAKARSYFLIGADREDIIQEGMIGLFKAIRDFRCDKSPPSERLRSFASPGRSSLPSKRRPARSTFPSTLTYH